MSASWKHFIALAALVGAFFATTREAFAQTPTVVLSQGTIKQVGPDGGNPAHPHPTPENPAPLTYQINRQDCLDDNRLRITATFTNVNTTTHSFQVWAGTGQCTEVTARSGAAGASCWPVYNATPKTTTVDLDIPVRDILAHQLKQPPPNTYSPAGVEACDAQTDTTGEKTITLYFMWLQVTTVANHVTYATKSDLRGPTPPTNVTAGPDDSMLFVSWTLVNDNDTNSFNVYCEPASGNICDVPSEVATSTPDTGTSTIDVGADPDSGVEGGADPGNGTETEEPATEDAAAAVADIDKRCGSANSRTSTQATATGLENGKQYVVRVAAVDKYGNPGPLSSLACETPILTDDFWDTYRKAGGQAGGGCTAVSTEASAPGSARFWLPAALAALVFVSRARRRRAR